MDQDRIDQIRVQLDHKLYDVPTGLEIDYLLTELAAVRQQLAQARQQLDTLAAALENLKHASGCFCKPNVAFTPWVITQHSDKCKAATAALAAATEAGAGDGVQRAAAQHAAGTERER